MDKLKTESLKRLPLLDMSKCEDVQGMFYYSSNFDLSVLEGEESNYWDLRNVKNATNMFYNTGLTSTDIITNQFKFSEIQNITQFVGDCYNLENAYLDLSGCDKIEDTYSMFSDCTSLKTVYIKGKFSNLKDSRYMFFRCNSLKTIYVDNEIFDSPNLVGDNMFASCESLVGGFGTTFNPDIERNEYAHIDKGEDNPGYLTPRINIQYRNTDGTNIGSSILYYYGIEVQPNNTEGFMGWSKAPHSYTIDFNSNDYNKNIIIYDINSPFQDLNLYLVIDNRKAFAVYSETDNSLDFYKRDSIPSQGITFNGKKATEVYTDVEDDSMADGTTGPSWGRLSVLTNSDIYDSVESISIIDEGIQPLTTDWWFYSFSKIQKINGLEKLDTTKVTTMNNMFKDCTNLQELNLNNFNTTSVIYTGGMFSGCKSIQSLDLTNFDTSNVTDMSDMFSSCSNINEIKFGELFITSKVVSMSDMFYLCSELEELDVSSFDISNVTSMHGMFLGDKCLTSIDTINFNTSNVTNMSYMFYNCSNITKLDLSSFDTSKVTNMSSMFYGCSNLTTIYVDSSKWDTDSVEITNVTTKGSTYMFTGCDSLIGGAGTAFSSRNPTDKTYAVVDGKIEDNLVINSSSWGETSGYSNNESMTWTLKKMSESPVVITFDENCRTENVNYDYLRIFIDKTTATPTTSGSVSGNIGGTTIAGKQFSYNSDDIVITWRSDSTGCSYSGFKATVEGANVVATTGGAKYSGAYKLIGYLTEKVPPHSGNGGSN